MPKLRSNDAPEPQACEPAEFLALTLRKKRAVAGYGTGIEVTGPRETLRAYEIAHEGRRLG